MYTATGVIYFLNLFRVSQNAQANLNPNTHDYLSMNDLKRNTDTNKSLQA